MTLVFILFYFLLKHVSFFSILFYELLASICYSSRSQLLSDCLDKLSSIFEVNYIYHWFSWEINVCWPWLFWDHWDNYLQQYCSSVIRTLRYHKATTESLNTPVVNNLKKSLKGNEWFLREEIAWRTKVLF